jgi:putative chitinase
MSVVVSSIDLQKIFRHMPFEKCIKVAESLNGNNRFFGITSKVALAHFLAQAAVESAEFTTTTENLNYSAEALKRAPEYKMNADGGFALEKGRKVLANKPGPFKYFWNNPEADLYGRTSTQKADKQAIANRAYARLGDGNVESGDGWRYIGRGFIQLTGKKNYMAFQKFYNATYPKKIDLEQTPEILAEDFNMAMISALWYFKEFVLKHLNIEFASVMEVTKRVNTGLKHLKEREEYFRSAVECLSYYDFTAGPKSQYYS